MIKELIAEGEFYRVFTCKASILIERKNDNASILLQGDDAWYFWDELAYMDETCDEEEHAYQLDVLCSDMDEVMCIPAISQLERGKAGWLKLQVA